MEVHRMNKKGNVFLGIGLGIFIFIIGVLLMPFLADDITTFRNAMSCGTSSISDGSKLTCLFGDALMPYFIWFFSSLAIGYMIGSRT